MFRIGLGNTRRERGSDAVGSRLKLRPTLAELEGRELLSTFTASSTAHDDSAAAMRSASGTSAMEHVFLHGNSKRDGSGLESAHQATHKRHDRSRRKRDMDSILSQTFNGLGFPSGWQQFLPGTVAQFPTSFLTIVDTTGKGSGILANASKTVPFNPVHVTTTITAVINGISLNPLGNAIFGLIGPNGPAQPAELAAGIDAQGNVFIVESSPYQKIKQTIVQVGADTSYQGGSVTLVCTIDSTGIQITAGNTTFKEKSFNKDLHNFSLKTAFQNGAIPALAAATQQGPPWGAAASFESITVSTAPSSLRSGRLAQAARPR